MPLWGRSPKESYRIVAVNLDRLLLIAKTAAQRLLHRIEDQGGSLDLLMRPQLA
jgi:hypothetical protein